MGVAVIAICACALSACSVGPDFVKPKLSDEAGYASGQLSPNTASADVQGGSAQHFVEAQDVPGQWWSLFHSDSLDSLIEEALKDL